MAAPATKEAHRIEVRRTAGSCRAPDIVEAILDGRQSKGLRLGEMPEMGLHWEEQRGACRFSHLTTSTGFA
jgi:hypothetical protein